MQICEKTTYESFLDFFESLKKIPEDNFIYWLLDSKGIYRHTSMDIPLRKIYNHKEQIHVSYEDEERFGEKVWSLKIPCIVEGEKCVFGVSIKNSTQNSSYVLDISNDECIRRKLAGINHDISTTINNTVQVLEVLKLTESSKEKVQYLDSMSYSLKSLKPTIEMLIKEEFLVNGFFEEISLIEISELLHGMYNLSAHVKKLDFDVDIDDKLDKNMKIRIMKTKFYRILINIINNSVKYTKKGHIKVKISILMNNLVVKFEDTGPGFPDHVLRNIRLKKTFLGEVIQQNSGFGWYIIIQYARQINAQILVQNTKNGSRVTMVMPLN